MTTLHSVAHQCAGGYSAEQLEAIKLFGKKDLTEGCLFSGIDSRDGEIYINRYSPFYEDKGKIFYFDNGNESIYDVEILGHEVHLEDLFRLAWNKGWEMSVSRGIKVWWLGASEMNPSKKIKYNPTLPLLDQPNLSDIISLFR